MSCGCHKPVTNPESYSGSSKDSFRITDSLVKPRGESRAHLRFRIYFKMLPFAFPITRTYCVNPESAGNEIASILGIFPLPFSAVPTVAGSGNPCQI